MRAKLPDQEGFLERDGVKVHYEVFGDGKETLMFLPAFPIGHSRKWKAQVPYFSQRYRCITYDPRGNGQSDRPEAVEAYHPDHLIGDALAILDELNIDQAIFIGLSMGGFMGSVIAAYHPERVRAAVLMNGTYPVGSDYGFLTPENFNATHDAHEGWQKYNRHYWQTDYPDFVEFFINNVFTEPHSTKPIEDGVRWGLDTDGETLAKTVLARLQPSKNYEIGPDMFSRITCPLLLIHGEDDHIQPAGKSKVVAELTGGELVLLPGAGHLPAGRIPAKINILIRDFLDRALGTSQDETQRTEIKSAPGRRTKRAKKALYLSSPIGLGHARRDLAITRELSMLHPDLEVDWLAQDPVTRFLKVNDERIHPASVKLVNESSHIESVSGEHDLHAFQALRSMDEILIANFMVFQEAVEQEAYDLVIADEAWDVDHFWHEHPELKKAPLAWFTDFVGFVPMASGGDHEAFLAADYNDEMIGHIESHPALRDRSIFVGNPKDIIPHSFGKDLPQMRDWIPQHFDFCGYVLGEHPSKFGSREELRARFGYREDEKVCVVTVGGSGVGGNLIRRILAAYPAAREKIPELRMILVTGPRLDPAMFELPDGVEARAFVPDLDRHLAACDLALVQGGLTTSMELAAAGTPFLYFPLKNHFEQNFHVAHRLDQYGAGRKMIFDETTPELIAEAMVEELVRPQNTRMVEADGAARAAQMLSDLL